MLRLARHVGAVFVVRAVSGCTLLLGYGDEAELAGASQDASPTPGPVADAAADGQAVPFCLGRDARPTFCASFDGPGYLAEWSSSDSTGARLERDTSSSVSPPASLRITAEPDGGAMSAAVGTSFAAWKDRAFTAVMGFDLQVVDAAPAGALAVIATPLLFATGEPVYILQLVARPLDDGTSVSLQLVEVSKALGRSSGHPSAVSVQQGAWSHLDLTVIHADGQHAVELLVDGQVGFSGPLDLATMGGTPSSSFGLAFADSNTTAWSLRFDNVTLDLR